MGLSGTVNVSTNRQRSTSVGLNLSPYLHLAQARQTQRSTWCLHEPYLDAISCRRNRLACAHGFAESQLDHILVINGSTDHLLVRRVGSPCISPAGTRQIANRSASCRMSENEPYLRCQDKIYLALQAAHKKSNRRRRVRLLAGPVVDVTKPSQPDI